MFFIIIERLWKISTQSVYILCRNYEGKCAAASEYISCFFKECVAASEYISYFLKNVRLLLKDINERHCFWKENVQLPPNIFFYIENCVAASRNISMFFNERAAASEIYQWTTASERKICFLELCPPKKYFEF